MPKIIEGLEDRLKQEARTQIEAAGYAAMTVRSVAAACGVGVGTVYNYFPSKDALIAAYMLEDWRMCMTLIHQAGANAAEPGPVLCCMYHQLRHFAHRHKALLGDAAAASAFAGAWGQYHSLLRSQLAKPLEPFCAGPFEAEFSAEALLTWTMAGKSCDEICGILDKLF